MAWEHDLMDALDEARELSPQTVERRIREEGLALIDVREDYEWEAGHVPGSLHIEMSQLGSAAAAIPSDKPVAFICLSGARSGMVATALARRGYDAYNVAGGFQAWFEAGLPTEPDDATVAH
jgi:rhodanese-related sulfurtransferase